jgi:hypothetical protein
MICMILPPAPAAAQGPYYPGSTPSIFPNYSYAPATFTATSQTSSVINLTGLTSGLVQVTGTALTTVTWAIKGSIDGGVTFFSLPTAAIPTTTVPITTTAVTQTTTASALYVVNLSGMTNVEFVTSGTFTATSVAIKLTASSNKSYL